MSLPQAHRHQHLSKVFMKEPHYVSWIIIIVNLWEVMVCMQSRSLVRDLMVIHAKGSKRGMHHYQTVPNHRKLWPWHKSIAQFRKDFIRLPYLCSFWDSKVILYLCESYDWILPTGLLTMEKTKVTPRKMKKSPTSLSYPMSLGWYEEGTWFFLAEAPESYEILHHPSRKYTEK